MPALRQNALVSVIRTTGSAGSTKETKNKEALKIAEEFERATRTKRTLKQVPIFFVNGSTWGVRLSVQKNDCDSGDNA
jgi:hypothetical protein